MNELDRKALQVVADWLHEQDPRYVWTPTTTTGRDARRPSKATPAQTAHPATQDAPADRHAA